MTPYLPTSLIAQHPNWHYADFECRAFQISAELQQRQLRAITVWIEDGAILACLLLGAWHANVRVHFPPNFTEESIQWANEHSELWLTDRDIELEKCEQISQFGITQDWKKVAKNQPLFDFSNQTEIWLKTSGSTGEAKTIIKTAEQMWLGGEVLAKGLPFPAENNITAISTVSIQHIYGLTVHIMMSLVNGWQIGRKQLFYPECVMQESNKSQMAVIVSSPAMLSGIDWQQMKISENIVGIISSGGALAEELSEQIRAKIHHPVIEIYGSTETGPIAIRDDISLWRQLPNSQLGSNEQGELWIEGVWLAKREQTADVVEFEENGFRLLGRADRIVKIGDKRISLLGVETALNKHEFVEDCYIAQHPEKSRLAAWIGLTEQGIQFFREKGRRALIHELKLFLDHSQEKAAIPRFWRFTYQLPRNSQSKINKLEFNRTCLETCKDAIWLEQSKNANSQISTGIVPLDLVYLKDHFAEFPLVPGVIELQWISEKIKAFFGKEVIIRSFDKLKYQTFLRPNDRFDIQLKWDPSKNRVAFQLLANNETCCTGLAIIEHEDHPTDC